MKIASLLLLTASFWLAAPGWAADEAPPPIPLAVAESEAFEAVGRLEADGLSWFIDRADSNVPVLGATLDVEAAGKTARAVFRPERGDYLIADAGWLQPLRQPGDHALALTLIAGEDSDLLAAELHVEIAPNPASTVQGTAVALWAAGVALLLALVVFGRRLRKGGAA